MSASTKWTCIFGNAPSMTEWRPEQYSKNITLIYPVTLPFEGTGIKLRFSNKYGDEAVTINCWSVFCGDRILYKCDKSIIMAPGQEYTTESFSAELAKGDKLNIRFYLENFTNMTSAVYTCGKLSGGKCLEGNFTIEAELDHNKMVDTNWNYFLTDVYLNTSEDKHSIICYGDSITAQDWPDDLYNLFLKTPDNHTAIVRKAVSGTRLIRQYTCNKYRSYGIKGDIRFPHESDLEGADIILIQHGINDIIHPVGIEVNEFRPWSDLPSAYEMIEVLQSYIDIAKQKKMKVYMGTLLPIKGWRTYADFREKLRNEINEWIRNEAPVDGVVDFDLAVRDSKDISSFGPGFDSGDHLHPSKAAYMAMAECAYSLLKE